MVSQRMLQLGPGKTVVPALEQPGAMESRLGKDSAALGCSGFGTPA